MRRLWLAAVMCGMMTGARAADLPVLRGGFTDGLSAPHVNWDGFYIGGQAGYGSADMNFNGTTRNDAAHLLYGLALEQAGNVSSWPVLGKASTRSSGFGGFAGYNGQWDDVLSARGVPAENAAARALTLQALRAANSE